MTFDVGEKLEFYLSKAKPLFEDIEVATPADPDLSKLGSEFLEMTLGYYNDALHFRHKGEHLRALMALEYAEGWLDAGKRIGFFK